MYTLKSIARRGTALSAAFVMVVASVVPSLPVAADALNPLTDRSLTLSSSSPGWDYLDGSGNTTYARPNSGANGQKTGNTFEFKVSTDTSGAGDKVEAMTFQYCVHPAGNCRAPGDNGWTDTGGGVMERNDDTATTSDLNVAVAGGANTSEATLSDHVTLTNSDGRPTSIPDADETGKNFLVYHQTGGADTPNDTSDDDWAQSTGWTMTAVNHENGFTEAAGTATGKMNEIQLTNSGGQGYTSGQMVRVVFFGTDTNYITNPGSGEFFVRINTYKVDSAWTADDVIDGGVTVANVMNQGIQITTKVLETMDFSVGTVDPYTLTATGSAGSQLETATGNNVHGVCENIKTKMDQDSTTEPANRLQLGDADGEFSLRTDTTYVGHSYWRLSSNSSAGATVYYSGNTLTNTVEDEIRPVGPNAAQPQPGSEQFGLALANGSRAENTPYFIPPSTNPNNVFAVNYDVERDNGLVYENGVDNNAGGIVAGTGIHSSVTDNAISNLDDNPSWHAPRLWPLIPDAQYDRGAGVVNAEYVDTGDAPTWNDNIGSRFAFDPASMLVPVALASQNERVVDCVTGKMRYIANIAATTPAGIYTTKINYIASPQY